MRLSRIERELRERYGPYVAGVDEVGRGPLAGPVVACAVVMPVGQRAIAGVDDSKVLSERDRDLLAGRIRAAAVAVGVGAASVREIDTYNIYQATSLAIRRAVRRLHQPPDHLLLDGRPIKSLGIEHTAVVDGDALCYAIACASIVAKVTRDRLMRSLATRYPRYAWERNVGYATPEHIAALDVWGATPHHRTSFRIKQLELGL
ncbi:MAG: ribonuclease HII [Gemmatimonadaceae bacterium]